MPSSKKKEKVTFFLLFSQVSNGEIISWISVLDFLPLLSSLISDLTFQTVKPLNSSVLILFNVQGTNLFQQRLVIMEHLF